MSQSAIKYRISFFFFTQFKPNHKTMDNLRFQRMSLELLLSRENTKTTTSSLESVKLQKKEEILKNVYKCKQLQQLRIFITLLSMQEDSKTSSSLKGHLKLKATDDRVTEHTTRSHAHRLWFPLGSRPQQLLRVHRQVNVFGCKVSKLSAFICKRIPKESLCSVLPSSFFSFLITQREVPSRFGESLS